MISEIDGVGGEGSDTGVTPEHGASPGQTAKPMKNQADTWRKAWERSGLQNRCPAPVAASGGGSIPMRFRQFPPSSGSCRSEKKGGRPGGRPPSWKGFAHAVAGPAGVAAGFEVRRGVDRSHLELDIADDLQESDVQRQPGRPCRVEEELVNAYFDG
jgi:hypothetical protein